MIYIEYGFDLDNNRFGFGRSVEIEQTNGTEYRIKEKIKLKNKRYYFRLWIGKYVLVISHANGFELVHKNRYNFKIIFGIKGEQDK